MAASLPLSSGSKVSEGTALPVATLRILVCGVCGVCGVCVECGWSVWSGWSVGGVCGVGGVWSGGSFTTAVVRVKGE